MATMKDGQAKCDKCGVLDGNTSITLNQGWKRIYTKDVRTSKHYCPKCSGG